MTLPVPSALATIGSWGEWTAFALIAAVILAGGLLAVIGKRTFHSALGLGVALVGVAALFISMGSPFIGVIQILVYVGGILTLLVFAVMFVVGDEEEATATPDPDRIPPQPLQIGLGLGSLALTFGGAFAIMGPVQLGSAFRAAVAWPGWIEALLALAIGIAYLGLLALVAFAVYQLLLRIAEGGIARAGATIVALVVVSLLVVSVTGSAGLTPVEDIDAAATDIAAEGESLFAAAAAASQAAQEGQIRGAETFAARLESASNLMTGAVESSQAALAHLGAQTTGVPEGAADSHATATGLTDPASADAARLATLASAIRGADEASQADVLSQAASDALVISERLIAYAASLNQVITDLDSVVAEDFGTLNQALFSDHVIALEVLGILLTAAMIGAMVIARPLGGRLDSENYATRLGRDDVETLQEVSDVDANLRGEN